MTRCPTLTALLLVSACAHSAGPTGSRTAATSTSPMVQGQSALVQQGFARVRAATAGFVSLDSAVAQGYAREVPRCYIDAHHGAMGYHHLNRGYVDAKAEVERPEILLYERRGDGSYGLNGVEYIIPFRIWPRDSVPPTIMGETMKPSEELTLWYLHMWIWKENPAGLFADWNRKVACPGQ